MNTVWLRRPLTGLLVGPLVLGLTGTARASSVLLGSDYFTTVPGTFFTLPVLGTIAFKGSPIPGAPGGADTIVQRQADAILPAIGSSDDILIEMVALSLVSVDPIDFGGSFFDVFVTLTPGTASGGMMRINHEFPDNGTDAPEGTFSSFFDVFFTLSLEPVGGGARVPLLSTNSLICQGAEATALNGSCVSGPPGFWSHELSIALTVVGPVGDQDANLHLDPPSGFSDFFPLGVTEEIKPSGGRHRVRVVPEPSLSVLLIGGLAGFLVRRGRRQFGSPAQG